MCIYMYKQAFGAYCFRVFQTFASRNRVDFKREQKSKEKLKQQTRKAGGVECVLPFDESS